MGIMSDVRSLSEMVDPKRMRLGADLAWLESALWFPSGLLDCWLVLALVICKLDYCNSVLAGLPTSTLNVLQKVQNAAVRLVCQLRPRDHVDSSLRQLHWLLIQSRVLYKQCILMYKVNCSQAPKYISDLVNTVAATATLPGLRCGKTNYCLPTLRTKFEEWAFSYSDQQPGTEFHMTFVLRVFKWKLKTHNRLEKLFSILMYDIVMHRQPTLL